MTTSNQEKRRFLDRKQALLKFEYEIRDLVFYRIVVWPICIFNEVILANLLYVLREGRIWCDYVKVYTLFTLTCFDDFSYKKIEKTANTKIKNKRISTIKM